MQPPARLSQRICRIRVSATMQAAAEAARLRAQGVDVVDFGPGEPDYPTPAGIKAAAVRAIEQDFTRYTAAGGTEELREAICRRHAADFDRLHGAGMRGLVGRQARPVQRAPGAG